MIWAIINIALSISAACVGVYMLAAYSDEIGALERIGISGMCAGCLMTVGPIFMKNIMASASPFDDWSASLMRVGCAIAFIGWMWRKDHARWRSFWRGLSDG